MTVFLNIVQESQELLGSLRHAVRGINRLRTNPPRNDRRETDTGRVSVSRLTLRGGMVRRRVTQAC